ncbi:hypothetical protein D3C73_1649960 [compost metagenome]
MNILKLVIISVNADKAFLHQLLQLAGDHRDASAGHLLQVLQRRELNGFHLPERQ